MLISTIAKIVPARARRRFHVLLVDQGWPVDKKQGVEGIRQVGHRGYVSRAAVYDAMGLLQYEFLLSKGLQPSDVLCDVGCGSLRGGRHLIKYLERGSYLGLEGEQQLVELGIAHELGEETYKAKAPEFLISYEFEFSRFSRSPTFALAVSLFTHLNEDDIRLCLKNLADHVKGTCSFFASFFETAEPIPNFKRSHAHLGFYYTREQMERFGRQAGWTPGYIGEWGCFANQSMMQFSITTK